LEIGNDSKTVTAEVNSYMKGNSKHRVLRGAKEQVKNKTRIVMDVIPVSMLVG